jgi:S-adenosylmethionine decarboxylase
MFENFVSCDAHRFVVAPSVTQQPRSSSRRRGKCGNDLLLSSARVIFDRAPLLKGSTVVWRWSELNTRGRHLLVEYTGCDPNVLDDLKRIETLMNQAAIAARTNIVASVFQPFEPQGVTGVIVVEESHLSIHTWPEYGYAAVDFFTCGDSMPELAHEVLVVGLKAQYAELMHVERGAGVPGRGIQLRSHHTEVNAEAAAVTLGDADESAMARLVS